MLLLLDRLTALETCVTSPPALTGRFTGWCHTQFVAPLEPELQAVLAGLKALGAVVSSVLLQRKPHLHAEQVSQLSELLAQLAQGRRALRARLLQVSQDHLHRLHQMLVGSFAAATLLTEKC